jgi:hypothetical protein
MPVQSTPALKTCITVSWAAPTHVLTCHGPAPFASVVRENQTPFLKLLWQLGMTPSLVEVATALLPLNATPGVSAIAPAHVSFAGRQELLVPHAAPGAPSVPPVHVPLEATTEQMPEARQHVVEQRLGEQLAPAVKVPLQVPEKVTVHDVPEQQ